MTVAIYSDINSIDPLKNPLSINVKAVFNSIYNILNTRPGERLFLPTFGCDIEDVLFEPMDEGTSLVIYQRIIEAIETWEPRVIMDYGRTDVVAYPDKNTYHITIAFSIRLLEEESFTFEGSIVVL